MKKLITVLLLAVLVAGGALSALPGASQAQVVYTAPPAAPYANPWVGPNTPWTYYNGDWFLNGVLQYFFGPKYGWAPYYAYPQTYVVRPGHWYGPNWNNWYRAHPVYWDNFHRSYPYWRNHHVGYRYGQDFYERHHHGQGGGWHRGWNDDRGRYDGHGRHGY